MKKLKPIEIEVWEPYSTYPKKIKVYKYRNQYFKTLQELKIHKENIEYYKRNPMGRSFAGYGHIIPFPFCKKCNSYHPVNEECKR